MPQGRIVLKRICQSRKLASLKTDGARLLYTWLIPNVDVNGCFSGNAQVIKGQIFTRLRKSPKIIEKYLLDLQDNGLVVRYIVNEDIYLQIPDFTDKQPYLNPDRESKTNIPLPNHDQLMSNSSNAPSNLGQIESKSKVKEKEKDKYRDFVFLTSDEHKKLLTTYGENNTDKLIADLNRYIGQSGKKYKSHYFTLLNFAKRNDMFHKETATVPFDSEARKQSDKIRSKK